MNRNFGSAILLIWISAYVVSGWGASNVGPNIADLASKIFWVFFAIWCPIFIIIVGQALIKVSKEDKNPLEKWR